MRWNGPAFKAGVSTGATLVAVNGHDYSPSVLKDAIKAARARQGPIELLLKYQGEYRTVAVDYHDGLQYPHLVRVEGTPDYLDEIIAAKISGESPSRTRWRRSQELFRGLLESGMTEESLQG